MTIYFCDDGGDNTDGLTWAKAKTTLSAAVALLVAGDDIHIGAVIYLNIISLIVGGRPDRDRN